MIHLRNYSPEMKNYTKTKQVNLTIKFLLILERFILALDALTLGVGSSDFEVRIRKARNYDDHNMICNAD